jgi:hypothetical protein
MATALQQLSLDEAAYVALLGKLIGVAVCPYSSVPLPSCC